MSGLSAQTADPPKIPRVVHVTSHRKVSARDETEMVANVKATAAAVAKVKFIPPSILLRMRLSE